MLVKNKKKDLKERLVIAAWGLFTAYGYDRTTIELIIENVGVSKGAFYHHFTDKQQVLDAVIDRMISAGIGELRLVAGDTGLSGLAKFNRFLAASRNWRLANMETLVEVASVVYRDENIIIRHKLYNRIVQAAYPLLTDIVAQGVREGVFHVADSEETAFFLLNLLNLMGDIQTRSLLDVPRNPNALGLIERRARLYMGFLERILGVPGGSIEPVDHTVFERISRITSQNRRQGKEEGDGIHEPEQPRRDAPQ